MSAEQPSDLHRRVNKEMQPSSDEGKQKQTCCCGNMILTERSAECATDLLDDLLHRCPAVLETLTRLPLRSLSALLITSHSLRDQTSAVLQSMYMVR